MECSALVQQTGRDVTARRTGLNDSVFRSFENQGNGATHHSSWSTTEVTLLFFALRFCATKSPEEPILARAKAEFELCAFIGAREECAGRVTFSRSGGKIELDIYHCYLPAVHKPEFYRRTRANECQRRKKPVH